MAYRHGDVASFETSVPGGDPYWVAVAFDSREGWRNTGSGMLLGVLDSRLMAMTLLVRDGRPVTG